MKSKNIKILLTILIVLIMAATFLGVNNYFKGEAGTKSINITIKNEENNEILIKKDFYTDAESLGDFLAQNEDELDVILVDSQYGRFVEGLMGLKTENMSKGPWWMYAYESPSQDIKMEIGQAPGVDTLGINDGDIIYFVFTTDMGF